MADAPPLLRFAGVTKRFGGTLAVDRIDLDVRAGSILALLGENGAGKSTLIKLLAGIHTLDAGQMLFDGQPYRHRPPARRRRHPAAGAGHPEPPPPTRHDPRARPRPDGVAAGCPRVTLAVEGLDRLTTGRSARSWRRPGRP